MILYDVEDESRVSLFVWKLDARGYALSTTRDVESGKFVLMHRLIMCAPPKLVVDHINGIKYDNRKANLRLCTQGQNLGNMVKSVSKLGTSKYKGVSLHRKSGLWRVRVKGIQYGYFKCEFAAAEKYNAIAIIVFGQFAKLNEIK